MNQIGAAKVKEHLDMDIRRLSLVSGARKAKGLTVIVDVFRAFTCAAYVLANGAERIFPVGGLEEAFRLKEKHPDWILMGERGGKKVEGFDYGNSPHEVGGIDFTGRTVVQTTSAGTRGIVNAEDAEEILAGSFVVAEATSEYIRKVGPRLVSIVAMGWSGEERSLEDELFADYLEARLRCRRPDFQRMVEQIRDDPHGAKFFDPCQPQFVKEDFDAAMSLDRFDFAIKLIEGDPPHFAKV